MSIHPGTTIGAVHLAVRDLEAAVAFYRDHLGFTEVRRDGATAYLGAGARALLALTGAPGAPRRRGTTGLYHFAILVPSRADLGAILRHLARSRTPLQGASDHLVSEALYLADPEGNGIEIYRDRDRAEWKFEDGQVAMATRALDLDSVLDAAGPGQEPYRLPALTRMGHVHLHVARIDAAERFYREILGLDVMARYGPSATFVSAGGYHHHIAFNTWAGEGAPPPAKDAAGLRWFELVLPDADALAQVVARVRAAGVAAEDGEGGVLVRDPAMNGVLLTAAG